jgi:type II secretory pathway pseudopilin PulG
MERVLRKFEKRSGFTIIELLTVMSIIIILMSLLLPGLNALRRYATEVKQRNQLRGIEGALEFYNAEWQSYPDSSALDHSILSGGIPYCGAMKLCEALIGQDMLGFHPKSRFYQAGTVDGVAATGVLEAGVGVTYNDLYPYRNEPLIADNVKLLSRKERKNLYLTLEGSNATRMGDLYVTTDAQTKALATFGTNWETLTVLCDVYGISTNKTTGKAIGMPILYYKADVSKHSHDGSAAAIELMHSQLLHDNIYNFMDNDDLVQLGLPAQALVNHPMKYLPVSPDEGPIIFYKKTLNESLLTPAPYRADSYILLSAGYDGLYGTKDDIYNFMK